MSLRVVEFDHDTQLTDDFLSLPPKLYPADRLIQNAAEERSLLESKHTLSSDFSIHKFLVYQADKVTARAALTIYPGDPVAYIGFFECIDDAAAAKALFAAVDRYSAAHHFAAIAGPVNASFWISYRLKIDHFDTAPYTGEPYNQPYYLKQFEDNGFNITQRYVSNIYKFKIGTGEIQHYRRSYDKSQAAGFRFVTPSPATFDAVMGDIYAMITELFSDFPSYKPLSEDQFRRHFNHFRYILDYSMVKIAYAGNEPAGFYIGLPDYGNLLYGELNFAKKLRILLYRWRARRYIMLYLGVRKKFQHQGLAPALLKSAIAKSFLRMSTSIGALILEGKVTQRYSSRYIDQTYHYVMLEKKIQL